MDLTQLSQMVTWIDEERRQDKAELAKLEQRLEGQVTEAMEQAKRIQDLEGRLASVQVQLVKLSQLDKALEQFKSEIMLLIKGYDERYQQAEREATLIRQMDRDAQSRALNEIRKELQGLPRYDEEMQARRTEEQRLSELIVNLQQDMAAFGKSEEDRARSLSYLEEQTRQDSRRIAELRQEITELLKQSEIHSAKLQLLEELSRRNESRIGELQELGKERKQEVTRFIEAQQLAEQHRQQQMAEWTTEAAAQRKRMEEYAVRMRAIAEQHELNKQALAALKQLEERLKREQNQVVELQRLAEERLRREWVEWQAEKEKYWERIEFQHDRRWKEQNRYDEEQDNQMESLEKAIAEQRAQLEILQRIQEECAYHRVSEAQNWVVKLEEHRNQSQE